MNKYIGRIVEIIYLDRQGKITQRRILVQKVYDGRVRAYCYSSRAPRLFDMDRIMAVQPVASAS